MPTNSRSLLGALRRNAILVSALLLLGATGGIVATLIAVPQYSSTAQVFITTQSADSASDVNAAGTYAQQVIKSLQAVAVTPRVLDPVRTQLKLSEPSSVLANKISVSSVTDQLILSIAVQDTSPRRAAAIANAVAEELGAVTAKLTPQVRGEGSAIRLVPLETASASNTPSSPRVAFNIFLGLLLGALAAVTTLLVRENLDQRIRTAHEFDELTKLTRLGRIDHAVTSSDDSSLRAGTSSTTMNEQYRAVRTAIQYLDVPGTIKIITVTSANPGEGKSTTATRLAALMAEGGSRVLLIDADFRSPAVHSYLALEGAIGLSDVIVERITLPEAVQQYGAAGLDVLPAGSNPPNPSELLQSQNMTNLIAQFRDNYDYVLIDTPPVSLFTDAAVVAKRSDGVIVVAAVNEVRRQEIMSCMSVMEAIGARLLGAVLTKTPSERRLSAYGGTNYNRAAAKGQ